MKKILFYTAALLLVACSTENKTVEGNLSNAEEGTTIFLEKLGTNSIEVVDSCLIADGQFSFSYPIEELGFYRVALHQNNFSLLVLEPNSSVSITADATALNSSSTVEGTQNATDATSLINLLNAPSKQTDSLQAIYQSVMGTAEEQIVMMQIRTAYEAIMSEHKGNIEAFIDNHPGSFVNLIAVQQLGQAAENIEYFKKVSTSLFENYPENSWVLDFKKGVDAIANTAVGALAPNFTLPDVDGNNFSLSDLRGKVVLLDFWASWCAPCRRENPHVVALYRQYHEQGFEVLGVSLDGDRTRGDAREAWLQAIDEDQLTWTHVSDLAGFASEAAKLYGIQSIPSTFLIDENGVIIARNLRGIELDNKLAEIFG
jgi:peroxiredoxin